MSCHGEAVIVRQLLGTYGIFARVVSNLAHRIIPVFAQRAVEFRVLVPANRLTEARTRLAEHRRQGFRLLRGGNSR